MPDVRMLPVPDGLEGERVDAAVSRLFGVSRTKAAELAADGHIQLDGRAAGKSDRVTAGAWLEATLPDPVSEDAPAVVPREVPGLAIIHDDTEIVVVDKPAGCAAHPSVGWDGPDVVSGLAAEGYRISTSGAAERQGIVQRLDVGTTGLMVVAKSERAYTVLKQAFRDRTVSKTYHAVVQGLPDPMVGTIEAPIGRHPNHDWKFAVRQEGRHSVTHYEVLEAFRHASLLEIHLETGRTHQIRVHFSALHHPCVGDPLYGSDPVLARRVGLDRQWLHARELGFTHPGSGEWVTYQSPYPADLQRSLDLLREG
ncbi:MULTISPECIES: RluA family pseudouridine synthase [Arsenicicoccus]|uniref:Pseudouridine synthase n=1 Tax=Arsenicicoccus bolidensis TaxID=229480 RepID=A0ABS9Q3X6_9MICO|nr:MULTISPECIES: RluA family pseudouridine synthase [Arsenicicoccus]MCG7322576.1 RluA family pseudouridine synthase [Arsenicicoccus bolidensis]